MTVKTCATRACASEVKTSRFVNSDVLRYKLTITVTLALYLQSKTATDVISTS